MEAATTTEIEEQLHLMNSSNLTLKDYANVYAAIHHLSISDKDNYLKREMVSTILTQYHVSKGLKNMQKRSGRSPQRTAPVARPYGDRTKVFR